MYIHVHIYKITTFGKGGMNLKEKKGGYMGGFGGVRGKGENSVSIL